MKKETRLPYKVRHFLSLTPKGQLAAFLRWVATKPAAEKFDYGDVTNCAKAQFGKSLMGVKPSRFYVTCGETLKFRNSHGDPVQFVSVIPAKKEDEFDDCKTFGDILKMFGAAR